MQETFNFRRPGSVVSAEVLKTLLPGHECLCVRLLGGSPIRSSTILTVTAASPEHKTPMAFHMVEQLLLIMLPSLRFQASA